MLLYQVEGALEVALLPGSDEDYASGGGGRAERPDMSFALGVPLVQKHARLYLPQGADTYLDPRCTAVANPRCAAAAMLAYIPKAGL